MPFLHLKLSEEPLIIKPEVRKLSYCWPVSTHQFQRTFRQDMNLLCRIYRSYSMLMELDLFSPLAQQNPLQHEV